MLLHALSIYCFIMVNMILKYSNIKWLKDKGNCKGKLIHHSKILQFSFVTLGIQIPDNTTTKSQLLLGFSSISPKQKEYLSQLNLSKLSLQV